MDNGESAALSRAVLSGGQPAGGGLASGSRLYLSGAAGFPTRNGFYSFFPPADKRLFTGEKNVSNAGLFSRSAQSVVFTYMVSSSKDTQLAACVYMHVCVHVCVRVCVCVSVGGCARNFYGTKQVQVQLENSAFIFIPLFNLFVA